MSSPDCFSEKLQAVIRGKETNKQQKNNTQLSSKTDEELIPVVIAAQTKNVFIIQSKKGIFYKVKKNSILTNKQILQVGLKYTVAQKGEKLTKNHIAKV